MLYAYTEFAVRDGFLGLGTGFGNDREAFDVVHVEAEARLRHNRTQVVWGSA